MLNKYSEGHRADPAVIDQCAPESATLGSSQTASARRLRPNLSQRKLPGNAGAHSRLASGDLHVGQYFGECLSGVDPCRKLETAMSHLFTAATRNDARKSAAPSAHPEVSYNRRAQVSRSILHSLVGFKCKHEDPTNCTMKCRHVQDARPKQVVSRSRANGATQIERYRIWQRHRLL